MEGFCHFMISVILLLLGLTQCVLGQEDKKANKWPNGVVPYELKDGDFDAEERFRIVEAFRLWEFGTCLQFRPATANDKNKIVFEDGVECSSPIGMQNGITRIVVNRYRCSNRGWYLHFLGHALGMIETHERPDRRKYIKFIQENLSPRGKVLWNKTYSANDVDTYGIPYDFNSIMHRDFRAYANGGVRQTIQTLDPSKIHLLMYTMFKWLSFYDVKLANLMYKCNKKCPADPKCKSPGYLNKACKCICPNGVNCGYGVSNCPTDYQDPRCDYWYKRGDCGGSNVVYHMALYCPRRCNCRNKWYDDVCESSAKRGECKTDAKFMLEWCKVTCNACVEDPPIPASCPKFQLYENPPTPEPTTTPPPTTTTVRTTTVRTLGNCRNKDSEGRCEALAKRGDCNNSGWMRINCPRSCNTCPGTCFDERTPNYCEQKQRNGVCTKDVYNMKKDCAKTCILCGFKQDCRDDRPECPDWARAGYCRSSSTTARSCRKSCGSC